MLDRARADGRRLADLIGRASGLAALKVRAQRLREQKDRINRDDIRDLERTRDELKESEANLSSEHDDVVDAGGQAKKEIERLGTDLTTARNQQLLTHQTLDKFVSALDTAANENYESATPGSVSNVLQRRSTKSSSASGVPSKHGFKIHSSG